MRNVAWLLTLADTNPAADTTTPGYWWSGKGDLVFESITWSGSRSSKGSLIDIGQVTQTIDLPGQRTTIRMAVTNESVRRIMSVDLGGIRVEIGWIYSTDKGVTWNRIPRRFKGRLSETKITNGVVALTVETALGDVDRGRPVWWSDASQRARSTNDEYFAQASALAGDRDIRWPPQLEAQ